MRGKDADLFRRSARARDRTPKSDRVKDRGSNSAASRLEKNKLFGVLCFFRFGNHPPSWIIGQVRRLADEFGRPGIVAKRGQTNQQVLAQGYLRTSWPSQASARKFQDAVEQLWGDLVSTKLYRK
jgi:hypothetical protein